jgi:hypothetical protein
VLWLYRLIGYGERVLPPVALYMVGALTFAVLRLSGNSISFTPGGVETFLSAFSDWLATPLHILNFTDDIANHWGFSQPWNTFARLLLAVPFATAALALRKYVKEGDGPE